MAYVPHILLFLVSTAIIWFFAGLLIESINRVARRFHQTGFTVAFFVLGFLTSISEISVMVNASVDHTPEVSAGNLVGASVVIVLFLMPFLAAVSGGVKLKNTLGNKEMLLTLVAILLPVLFVIDGNVTRREGFMCFAVYAALLYLIPRQNHKSMGEFVEEVEDGLAGHAKHNISDGFKILLGAVFIFGAAHYLVEESVYFAQVLNVPSSIIGLLILSVGTNVPELVVAFRSIQKKHKDIALGDYLGSALANTLVFGFLPWLNGNFNVEKSEFEYTAVLMIFGFLFFYIASRSKNQVSRKEAFVLLGFYVVFIVVQFVSLIHFATN